MRCDLDNGITIFFSVFEYICLRYLYTLHEPMQANVHDEITIICEQGTALTCLLAYLMGLCLRVYVCIGMRLCV